jgi:hypothetical protein
MGTFKCLRCRLCGIALFQPSVDAAEAFGNMNFFVEPSGMNLRWASTVSAHAPTAGHWNQHNVRSTLSYFVTVKSTAYGRKGRGASPTPVPRGKVVKSFGNPSAPQTKL